MFGFKQFINFFEQQEKVNRTEKVAVFATGRLNPPTIGHELLVKNILELKKEYRADEAYLFPTKTYDGDKAGKRVTRGTNKGKPYEVKNPLKPEEKLQFIRQLIETSGILVELNTNAVTALVDLAEKGFTKVIYVAGGDYFDGDAGNTRFMEDVLPKKAKELGMEFNSVSAGKRDSTGKISSVSASKARKAAMNMDENAFELFEQATGWEDEEITKRLLDAVRIGLGVK